MILTKSIEISSANLSPMTWAEAVEACKALGDGWRLPTKEELDWMYQHKDKISGFGEGWLWASTHYSNYAWGQRFSDGNQGGSSKYDTYAVRACRDLLCLTEDKQEEPFDINRLGRTVPVDISDEEWKATRNAEREAAYVSRLRDKFAGQAIAGIAGEGTYRSSEPWVMARNAYRFADAMLAERAKEIKNA
jgi:hypothetical protein